MAAIQRGLSIFSNLLCKTPNLAVCDFQQVRNVHLGRWMVRDQKRRMMVKQYAVERLRLLALKRNDVLPIEIREEVAKEIDKKIPRQTALRQLTPRCIVTSRPRGVVRPWRLSRIVFRHLVDYNKMSGVQRALW